MWKPRDSRRGAILSLTETVEERGRVLWGVARGYTSSSAMIGFRVLRLSAPLCSGLLRTPLLCVCVRVRVRVLSIEITTRECRVEYA
jgi:hypothetical protein